MTIALKPAAHSQAFIGCVGTGKTQRLIDRVCQLLNQGYETNEIVVFCAAPQAIDVMRYRLRLAGVSLDVHVLTVREFALDVLDARQARDFTHREARMLLPYEEDFLLEDLKTSGIKSKRLKEMLKFFSRNWTELNDDDTSWLLEGEEVFVHTLVKSCLAFTGAMLEPEISNFAVRYLCSHHAALPSSRIKHVLVDDYQTLSRASQVLTSLIAGESVALAADLYAYGQVFESYPYAAGTSEFLATNPQADVKKLTTCWRAQNTTRIVNLVLSDTCMARAGGMDSGDDAGNTSDCSRRCVAAWSEAADGSLVEMEFKTPQDELQGVADYIQQALDDGMLPRDICVVFANTSWGREVQRTLEKQSISCAAILQDNALRGDVRDASRCSGARMFALLSLAADDQNASAWRSICGFGDYLAKSPGFKALRVYAQKHKLSLPTLLAMVSGESFSLPDNLLEISQGIAQAYERTVYQLEQCRELTGQALVDALTSVVLDRNETRVPVGFLKLLDPVESSDSAADLYYRAIRHLTAPGFSENALESGVRLLNVQSVSGQNPRLLIVTGFVNGFIPQSRFFDKSLTIEKEMQAMWSTDLHLMYAALGKAGEMLIASRFTRISVEDAERFKLKIDRIRVEDGCRVCAIGASEFLKLVRSE
jgi:superfamily I DNA/RNA helicase